MPAPGFRFDTSGTLYDVGGEGSVWSASAYGTSGVYLRFLMNAAQPAFTLGHGYGFQLRCLSE